jgi:predicted permease
LRSEKVGGSKGRIFMGFYLGSMILTVISNGVYHLSQRSIHPRVNPLVSLLLTYAVAMAATLVALPFFGERGEEGWLGQVRSANWASYALGLAAVGLELGFLLAYRSGWRVSIAALVSNALVTLLLVPAGLLFFCEGLDGRRAAGVMLASAGIWLMSGR